MKNMNSNKFVLDLDSSMNSAQGLLSFMTDASKQIKTFLDDNNEAKTKKDQRKLLQHLNTLNFEADFIPSISTTYMTTTPASPTPSLDSVGSSFEDDVIPLTSCRVQQNSRKRKLTNDYSFRNAKISKPRYNSCLQNTEKLSSNSQQLPATRQRSDSTFSRSDSFDSVEFDYIIPSPSPDFSDLINCMLTDEFTTPFDFSNYLAN